MSGKILRELGREDSATHAPGLVVPSAHLDVAVGGPDGTIWVFGGYSLAFGKSMGGVIGNFSQYFALQHMDAAEPLRTGPFHVSLTLDDWAPRRRASLLSETL